MISRLLTIIGLFCRISSLLKGSFAKETYNFKEPTNCSHPPYCFPCAGALLGRVCRHVANETYKYMKKDPQKRPVNETD